MKSPLLLSLGPQLRVFISLSPGGDCGFGSLGEGVSHASYLMLSIILLQKVLEHFTVALSSK